jgi:hypothetical protein
VTDQITEVKTIGEVEILVHGSGQWDGTEPVEFSNDGAHFAETWTPTEEHPHPQFARVTVHRKDVKIPTRKTIRWDEQYPAASEEWAGKWDRSPMRHFGRTVRMVAFRETFRDIVGNIAIEDEARDTTRPTPPAPAEERDWAAEFAAAVTIDALDAVVLAARRAKAFKATAAGTALDIAQRARYAELRAAAEVSAPEPAAQRPATHDHLPPTNRAGRRAQARRKKGGRR